MNKIIVLSHSGYGGGPARRRRRHHRRRRDRGRAFEHLPLECLDRAAGPYPTVVNDVCRSCRPMPIGKFLGELNVVFDDEGVVTSAVGEPLIMDRFVRRGRRHQGADRRGWPLRLTKSATGGGRSRRGHRSASATSAGPWNARWATLIADAMLDRVKDQGIEIAIQNGGGIRASIDAVDVTMGEVLTVLPFQNTLSTFEVSGATFVEALENGVSQVEEGAGRFPQVAGRDLSPSIPQAEAGSRISGRDGRWPGADRSGQELWRRVEQLCPQRRRRLCKMFKSMRPTPMTSAQTLPMSRRNSWPLRGRSRPIRTAGSP